MTDLPVDELLTRLSAALGREFGEIRFWGFAVVRPSDRRWRLESVEREGSTLLLGLRDMAGPPLPALLSLDRPIGLTVSAHGLTFERADEGLFPCLRLAREAYAASHSHPAVLNAANEVAVELFLNGTIGFMDIPRLIEAALGRHRALPEDCAAADLLAVDAEARRRARQDAGL